MYDMRFWLPALGVVAGVMLVLSEPAAAQNRPADVARSAEIRTAGADGAIRSFSTESGVGVALGRDGAVEVTLPDSRATGSPFSGQRGTEYKRTPRVDPPTHAPKQPVPPRLPAEVQGLLNRFAPKVRVGEHGVKLETDGVRLDTRGGVNVDLETPSGRVQISQRAIEDFSAARKLFREQDYRQALRRMDFAVEHMPHESRFRQFRALVHFALGDFGPVADDAYQALTLGSAWDWQTVRGFYAEPSEYTAQYQSLQRSAHHNKQSAELNFLLAYHYTVLGHHDAALQQWKLVDQLLPGDRLILALIEQLEERPGPPAAGN